MSRNESIEVTGKVTEVLPDSKYRVLLENGHLLLGHLSGRMKQNRISVTNGDSVLVELTPYDLSRGRIVRRFNPGQSQQIR